MFKNTEGIILFSGSIQGFFGKLFNKGKFEDIKKLYKKLSSLLNDRFYLEIQRHGDINELEFSMFKFAFNNTIKSIPTT